jgi:hypothetical protein
MTRKPAAVSMQPHEYEAAKARAVRLGMNFSAYINALIRADMRGGGELVLREAADGPALVAETLPPSKPVKYKVPKKKKQ